MSILKEYLSKLFKLMNKQEMKILPGHLAFFLILSLIPTITLIGIICNIFGISTFDILNFFSNVVPKGVVQIIEPFITTTSKGSITIYLFIGFILASNGAHAIILTSNTLYEIKDSNYVEDRIKALFLIILIMFLFIFILLVLAFGNIILKFILSLKIFSNISNIVYDLFVYLKWPIAFLVIYIILKLIYTITPDKKIKSKSVTKGSIFTTMGWLFVTAIYSYYANNIAHYDLFYGSLSNIIILMMWIYIVAYIFVVGIAINVNNYMEENVIDKKD
jgi:membrane protein